MNLGILMSLYNQRYFRDRLSTLCEFIPQVYSSSRLVAHWTLHLRYSLHQWHFNASSTLGLCAPTCR